MIRKTTRYAALLTVVAMAACSDSPNSPAASATVDLSADPRTRAPATAPVYPSSSGTGSSALASVAVVEPVGTLVGDTTVVSFSVNYKKEAVYMLGRHWIYFQAHSICDPNKSSYGETEWNNSCQPARYNVPITARIWADTNGRPVVSFSPHLRFEPTKYVVLHMSYDIAGLQDPKILWFKKEFNGANGIDEAAQDEALVTQKDDQLLVYRRIKHFSGYTLSTGFLARDESIVEGEVNLGLNSIGTIRTVAPAINSGHVVATGAIGSSGQEDR